MSLSAISCNGMIKSDQKSNPREGGLEDTCGSGLPDCVIYAIVSGLTRVADKDLPQNERTEIISTVGRLISNLNGEDIATVMNHLPADPTSSRVFQEIIAEQKEA